MRAMGVGGGVTLVPGTVPKIVPTLGKSGGQLVVLCIAVLSRLIYATACQYDRFTLSNT